ncbi:MAG TPA: monovalent cation/H(+) antiporter subunit G [Halanaerobiales bacterium]|nr:monovalent cation/H(+) antiporter subunit G [Halanaerobiales bacterium]
MILLSFIGYVLIILGSIFLLLGSLGIVRMPDLYNRIQAGTKATTLGALSAIIGVGLVEPSWFFKTLIIAVFIVLTNPIGSHSIARSSYKRGLKPVITSEIDEYDEENLTDERSDSA